MNFELIRLIIFLLKKNMNTIEKIKNRRNESRQNMMKKVENKDTKNHNLMIVDVDLQKCLNCSFTIQKVDDE